MKEHLELSSLGASLLAEAERISGEIQDWRRDFHQFPEFAFEENITASKITNVMRSIPGMAVTTGFAIQTSVIGVLGAEIPGPALMLRATMDATAAEEQTGLPFSSCMPGAMHGCGHDAEMASLLGAASVLSKYRGELKQRVVFLFQPAGEGRSGAKTLTENNIIEKFHIGRSVAVNWASELPYGELFTRRGVMTALSDRIHIDIRGTAGHAAEPHMTVDPVTIAANVIIMIQTMLSREVDPREPVVVSFGQVESGEAYNIIPEQANLWGTLRAFSYRAASKRWPRLLRRRSEDWRRWNIPATTRRWTITSIWWMNSSVSGFLFSGRTGSTCLSVLCFPAMISRSSATVCPLFSC